MGHQLMAPESNLAFQSTIIQKERKNTVGHLLASNSVNAACLVGDMCTRGASERPHPSGSRRGHILRFSTRRGSASASASAYAEHSTFLSVSAELEFDGHINRAVHIYNSCYENSEQQVFL